MVQVKFFSQTFSIQLVEPMDVEPKYTSTFLLVFFFKPVITSDCFTQLMSQIKSLEYVHLYLRVMILYYLKVIL